MHMAGWFHETFEAALNDVPEQYRDPDRFVPGTGNPDADVILVGEAPGANEVEHGEPFVGRAGQRLDEMLNDIGVSRADLYITNVVKVRPPDNRDPTRDEIDAWKPVLDAEIEHVAPDTVVAMGNFAARELTGARDGITAIHGKVFRKDDLRILPTFHPAATLYDRSKGPDLKADLRMAFGTRKPGQQSLADL